MEVRDPIYCFEIARRSVGRAALHLGIESMTEASLDVMADVLLQYLNRVGRTLSHLVESSGRTSAHANILDALQACQVVTSPAVQRLHLKDPGEEESLFATTASPAPSSTSGGAAASAATLNSPDWKGLAAFLFGPRWLEDKDEDGKDPALSMDAAGGKRGPSAVGSTNATEKGWEAPYLDEVPHFPHASEACANPHPMAPHVGLSLHRATEESEQETTQLEETELDQLPDQTFVSSSWGDIGNKRKFGERDATADVAMEDASSSPASKRARLDDGAGKDKTAKDKSSSNKTTARPEDTDQPPDSSEAHRHAHVPSFYPPPPPALQLSKTQGRTVVSIDAQAASMAKAAASQNAARGANEEHGGSRSVRSSLVQLGQYWGSGWDSAPTKGKLVVPLGRAEGNETTTAIVPLGRASGSRVSRILEGSMDAAAMQ